MSVVKLEHVYKTFGKHDVLKDLNLELEKGKVYAFTGESGCGKSTLMNLLGLLDKPTSGTITLFGKVNIQPSSKESRILLRDKIGYLFQNFALIENQSVEYNLKLAITYDKERNKKEKVRKALDEVCLSSYEKQKKFECSGGEQQRVALARLLLKPCELILADEPTGSLDEKNKQEVWMLLKNLKNEGKTIVIVTHDLELANKCDEIISLSKN